MAGFGPETHGQAIGADGVGAVAGILGLLEFLLLGIEDGDLIQGHGHHGVLFAHRIHPEAEQALI